MQPMDAVVAILGAALDGITMVAVVREHRRAVRAMAVLHICLMIPVTLNGLVPLAIIRLLVASFLARLVACLVELDWVLTGQPLTRKPSPAWLQGGCASIRMRSAALQKTLYYTAARCGMFFSAFLMCV